MNSPMESMGYGAGVHLTRRQITKQAKKKRREGEQLRPCYWLIEIVIDYYIDRLINYTNQLNYL